MGQTLCQLETEVLNDILGQQSSKSNKKDLDQGLQSWADNQNLTKDLHLLRTFVAEPDGPGEDSTASIVYFVLLTDYDVINSASKLSINTKKEIEAHVTKEIRFNIH